ncbi:MAG: guanylate kinase [Verrucomicrobia bacterium]|nr:guanylate kinase [Verrucomicrobiota bacterium]
MNRLKIQRTGILFVLSAPSGAGKTTLISSLRQKPDFVYSVSCTTRPPRRGEVDGEDYFFLTEEQFEERAAHGDFLEHARVHGHLYGTPKSTVVGHLKRGVDVLLDIDTLGAAEVRANPDPFIQGAIADVFIMPPGLDELGRRLRKRGTEGEEQIATRLRNAAAEMSKWREYRYTIISGSMEEDIEKFRGVMRAERYLSRRLELDFE